MISFYKKLSPSHSNGTSAELVDNHLVLSMLDAQEPKIWRMALDKIGTASFELKSVKGSDETKLVLRPKKGTAEIIATYDTKDQAFSALTKASNALQGKNTSKTQSVKSTQTVQHPAPAPTPKQGNKWGVLLLAALLVVGLYMYLNNMMPTLAPVTSNNTGNSVATSPQNETGVPLSADDFLSGM